MDITLLHYPVTLPETATTTRSAEMALALDSKNDDVKRFIKRLWKDIQGIILHMSLCIPKHGSLDFPRLPFCRTRSCPGRLSVKRSVTTEGGPSHQIMALEATCTTASLQKLVLTQRLIKDSKPMNPTDFAPLLMPLVHFL